MCGICGVATREANHPLSHTERVMRMRDTMIHRGPDEAGLFHDSHITLAQRRLSIIDLSGGSQPMASKDGKLWVLNNGEIYNYLDLRKRLMQRGYQFQTQSDTEAIIYAYKEYGIDCVQHLKGMFALAVWDVDQLRLFLARDRLGEKPLYYAITPEGLQFASELKALIVDGSISKEIDHQALVDYLAFAHISSPLTIFKNVRKLPPAHALSYDVATGELKIWRYWEWNGLGATPARMSYNEAVDELQTRLAQAVHLCMISDVPLGALLSGGVDSTAVVTMMARQSSLPVKTFTIGWNEPAYDESAYAERVAKHFGTEHYREVIQPIAVEELLPKLARQYDEPFADSSALPTYYVCQMARQHVTVALGGDGGDEGFGGYGRYLHSQKIEQLRRLVPDLVSKALLVPVGRKVLSENRYHWLQRNLLPPDQRYQQSMMLYVGNDLTTMLCSDWQAAPRDIVLNWIRRGSGQSHFRAMQYADINDYLPEDILVKVDRASMLNSLETRAPLLDYELLEFAGSLPVEWVYGKRILKDAIRSWVPTEILDRPKQGFGIPLGAWFKHGFRNYGAEVLFDSEAFSRNIFCRNAVQSLINSEGNTMDGYKLWALVMFELWAKTYLT